MGPSTSALNPSNHFLRNNNKTKSTKTRTVPLSRHTDSPILMTSSTITRAIQRRSSLSSQKPSSPWKNFNSRQRNWKKSWKKRLTQRSVDTTKSKYATRPCGRKSKNGRYAAESQRRLYICILTSTTKKEIGMKERKEGRGRERPK